jgi:hypothetical protein
VYTELSQASSGKYSLWPEVVLGLGCFCHSLNRRSWIENRGRRQCFSSFQMLIHTRESLIGEYNILVLDGRGADAWAVAPRDQLILCQEKGCKYLHHSRCFMFLHSPTPNKLVRTGGLQAG